MGEQNGDVKRGKGMVEGSEVAPGPQVNDLDPLGKGEDFDIKWYGGGG